MITSASVPNPNPPTRPPVSTSMLASVVLFITLVLVRLVWLQNTTFDIPYWDQWGAVIDRLFARLHEGTFALQSLFVPHNVHPVVWTKLVELGLYAGNSGYFDNRVVACANTLLYSFTIVLLLWPTMRSASHKSIPLGFGLILGTIPYDWANLATGFQNAFYFLNFFLVAAVWVASHGTLTWQRLTLLLCLSLGSVFSIATGLFTPCIVMAILLIRHRSGTLRLAPLLLGLGVLTACIALGLFELSIHGNKVTARPDSLLDFVVTWLTLLAWPSGLARPWFALVLWAPAAWCFILTIRDLWHGKPVSPIRLQLLAIAAWAAMQAAAFAFGRAAHPDELSRYSDTMVLGGACNILLALNLVKTWSGTQRQRQHLMAGTMLLTALFSFALVYQGSMGYRHLMHRATLSVKQIANQQRYLATGDYATFASQPDRAIGYPGAARLKPLFNRPAALRSLPPSIVPPLFDSWPKCRGFVAHGTQPVVSTLRYPYGVIGTWVAPLHSRNKGRCRSAVFGIESPYILIKTAGYLDRPGLSASLVDEHGRAIPIHATRHRRDVWSSIVMKVRPGTYHLQLNDNSSKYWFAIAPPQPVGRLSAWVTIVLDKALAWLACWLVLVFCAGLFLELARQQTRPGIAHGHRPLG